MEDGSSDDVPQKRRKLGGDSNTVADLDAILGTSHDSTKKTVYSNSQNITHINDITANELNINIRDVACRETTSTFDNIVATTRNNMNHFERTMHVQTRAERDVPGILQQHKCVFVKGRSGSGKTRLGLNILHKVAEQTGRIPVQLASWQQWDLIPKTDKKRQVLHDEVKQYVVMLDDVFGSCTLLQSSVDEWAKLFEIMWPEVDSGHVILVLLSRPEILSMCQNQLKKYKLIENMKTIDLDYGEFTLDKEEKKQILQMLCNDYLNDREMNDIVTLETGIGFPQCCQFFSKSQEAQKMKMEFFKNPALYILQEINTLHERDGLGYLVLLILLLKDGKLSNDDLCFRPKPEFVSLVTDLRNCCSNVSEIPTMNQIKDKTLSLCGVYFTKTGEGFEFQHQSISDAVFCSISSRNLSICMEKCTPRLLVNYVRHCQVEDSQIVVPIPTTHHDQLVDKITDNLLGEDYKIILDHPCLYQDDFARLMIERWQEKSQLKTLVEKKHDQKFIPLSDYFSKTFPCPFESLFSSLILKKAYSLVKPSLAKYNSMIPQGSVSGDVLSCAIYVEENSIIRTLLQCVTPTEVHFMVLCHTSKVDTNIVENIFESVENMVDAMENITDLFGVCVMRGNTQLVKLLVDKLGTTNIWLKQYSKCLESFIQSVKRGFKHHRFDSETTEEMTRLLLKTGCKVNKGRLVWLAAAHPHAGALEVLLEDDSVCLTERYAGPSDNQGGRVYYITTPLHQAVLAGSVDNFKLLLERNKEDMSYSKGNELPSNGRESLSSLHFAALKGRVEIIKLLISKGANVDSMTSNGATPLHFAILYGHSKAVRVLLENKARLDIETKHGDDPEPFPSSFRDIRYTNVVECLVDFGVNLQTTHIFGTSLLHVATESSDGDTVRFLCEHGLDVNRKNIWGNTVLHVAVGHSDFGRVKYLCEKGASVNAVNKDDNTVLHVAVNRAGFDIVKYLCEKGASLNVVNNHDNTVLHVINRYTDVETVKYMCEKGTSVNAANKIGDTVLHVALERACFDIVKYLCEKGASVNAKNKEDNTVLHVATRYTDTNTVKYLCEKGSSVIAVNKYGNTALHVAVEDDDFDPDDFDLVEYLCENGASVNAANNDGDTVLHLATRYTDVDTVKYLCEKGAPLIAVNKDGNTALHVAVEDDDFDPDDFDLVEYLCENGASVNAANNDGDTVLHLATRYTDVDTVKYLCEKGAPLIAVNKDGNTALHVAVEHADFDTVKCLYEWGAFVNAVNHDGDTVLSVAYKHTDFDIVKFLLDCGAFMYFTNEDGEKRFDYASVDRNVILQSAMGELGK